MSKVHAPTNLQGYLTVSAAAAFLGITAWTLRLWDRAGKLKPHRHPLNRYRLDLAEDLRALLTEVSSSKLAGGQRA
jgi:predicted site-specific integrase-resolvase